MLVHCVSAAKNKNTREIERENMRLDRKKNFLLRKNVFSIYHVSPTELYYFFLISAAAKH